MISAALLVAFAVTAGTRGATALTRARWAPRSPRLAMAAWQALALSVLFSIVAAGAALGLGVDHVRVDLAHLFHLCAENLRRDDARYASPVGALLASLGVLAPGILVTRTVWCAVSIWGQDVGERRARVSMLDMVGRADIVPGVLVLDHHTPYAFCIGGRRQRVVVTKALLNSLDQLELNAVLAHEAAHLRQRHHLVLMICRTTFGTLTPLFPAFRTAMPLVRLYAELSADDGACRRVGAAPLRSALLRVACLPAPLGTLAASASDVEMRLVRLADERGGLSRHRAFITGVTIGALAVIPLTLATAPILAMTWEVMCLIS